MKVIAEEGLQDEDHEVMDFLEEDIFGEDEDEECGSAIDGPGGVSKREPISWRRSITCCRADSQAVACPRYPPTSSKILATAQARIHKV
ncbi:hypothetical protein J4Q44_G00255330 [Coregonus suidteri]|uniref:Uncharacterized protein n=1 Tax=Coregonus suidteri TaxID=861788 RepID=A0AAN8QEW8_9TELE